MTVESGGPCLFIEWIGLVNQMKSFQSNGSPIISYKNN